MLKALLNLFKSSKPEVKQEAPKDFFPFPAPAPVIKKKPVVKKATTQKAKSPLAKSVPKKKASKKQ